MAKKRIQGTALWSGRRRQRRMVDGVFLRSTKWPLMIEAAMLAEVRAAAAREGVTLSLWIGDAIRRRLGTMPAKRSS